MKGLKEALTLPWTRKIEASHFFMPFAVSRLVQLFTIKDTKRLKEKLILPWVRTQNSPLLHDLHALRGWKACTALYHEGHEEIKGEADTALRTETELSTSS